MSNEEKKTRLSYADSGVNIDAMAEGLGRIEKDVRSTFNDQVIENVGGFGTLFRPDISKMKDPVLISSVDGVGTKLMIARMMNTYTTVGQDIVNHCVDDILVQGAKPLYFLDYVGAGVLKPEVMQDVISGLARACRENGMCLIGGETAEMPGIYGSDDLDLVGSIVGIADREDIITGQNISQGDAVLGFPSTGLHTNGYSLARKLFFEVKGFSVNTEVPELGCSVGEELLKVHKSYFNIIYPRIKQFGIKGLAHITGGGFRDNIPRILPEGTAVSIEKGTWEVPPVFTYIQEHGNVEEQEMFRAFNMGIGMIAVLPEDRAAAFISEVSGTGEQVLRIGSVVKGEKEVLIND